MTRTLAEIENLLAEVIEDLDGELDDIDPRWRDLGSSEDAQDGRGQARAAAREVEPLHRAHTALNRALAALQEHNAKQSRNKHSGNEEAPAETVGETARQESQVDGPSPGAGGVERWPAPDDEADVVIVRLRSGDPETGPGHEASASGRRSLNDRLKDIGQQPRASGAVGTVGQAQAPPAGASKDDALAVRHPIARTSARPSPAHGNPGRQEEASVRIVRRALAETKQPSTE